MANSIIKWISTLIFWVILKIFQLAMIFKALFSNIIHFIRKKAILLHFNSEADFILQEIREKITKQIDHVSIWCMESFDENTERQLIKLSSILEWLRLWNVKYITLYIDNLGTTSTSEVEKIIENTLNQLFKSSEICWANTKERINCAALILNILTKDQVSSDLCGNVRDFWSKQIYWDQSLDITTSNYKVIDYLKANSDIYLPMRDLMKKNFDDSKTYFESHNPDLTLLFNPNGFSLGNFPPLMREFSEMFQCGSLGKVNILTFYDLMMKFSNIEQRWGI